MLSAGSCWLGLLLCTMAVASAGADGAALTVYYEAGCPDSQNFIENSLGPVMKHIPSSLKLQLVPWGKATLKGKTREQTHAALAKWPAGAAAQKAETVQFDCQHGSNECKVNRLHLCAIAQIGAARAFPFIKCSMGSFWGGEKAWEKCATPPLTWTELTRCAGAPAGRALEATAAVTTAAIPLFPYVPWVLFQGHHMHCRHGCDLLHLVCHALRTAHKACNDLSAWEATQRAAPFKTPCLNGNADVPHGWKGVPTQGKSKGCQCECVFGWLKCAATAAAAAAGGVAAATTRSPISTGLGPRCKFVRCELTDEVPRSAGKAPKKRITWDKAAEAFEAKHHVCVKNHATGVCECFCGKGVHVPAA